MQGMRKEVQFSLIDVRFTCCSDKFRCLAIEFFPACDPVAAAVAA